jgi:outer membrane protein OmpA-like peptidoglycan-associated protein
MATDGRAPQALSTISRSTTGRLTRWLSALLAAVLVLLTAACGSGSAATEADAALRSDAECEVAAEHEPVAGAEYEVVVVDRSASGAPRALPPAVTTALTAAQEADRTLMLIGVDGPTAEPRLGRTLALDPMPGDTSPFADDTRTRVLECIPTWIQDEDLVPTAPGSDQLAALAAAARQQPAEVVVISDGVSSSLAMDLGQIGYDADAESIAGNLASASVLPRFDGTPVVWTGLGETAVVISEAARRGLEALWTHVLTASGGVVAFDTRFERAENGEAGTGDLPEDAVPGETLVQPEGAASCFRLPSGTLFAPDSTQVASTAGLEQVAAALIEHPGWLAVVSGHVADFGPEEGQVPFSEARAQAVVQVLRQLGVPGSVELIAVGHGASRQVAPEWVDGVHDHAAAAMNRRVDVVYGSPDSVTTQTECGQS